MKKIITEEKIETATNEYLEKYKDDIEELVNKKVGSAVNKSISNAFSTSSYGSDNAGWARKMVENMVDEKIEAVSKDVLKETTVSKEDIAEQVNKKIKAKLRKINVDIDF